MSGKMRMQPEEIRSGGKKIGNAGDDLDQVLNTLKSSLDGEGECWGDDEAGQKFGGDYTKGRDSVLESLKKVVKALGDIDDNLKATADDTESGDEQSASGIGKSGSNMPR
ncbi:WXG100 family type VII secretion target [Saccharopolyspora sp. TS4A08]|uniref:WXG100 family type VII secretion target n=1 Tax=Saccharopolyspora ipomoeae TaxID=3042027 RepID=A0ABT6PSM6_9PSEU|nr:WXG100 family type VII secretion target [Saccharopolyspora sp. TS4A08]MDI2030840.1 WXG100 family type VII secretion target [Saccharopolyspora sp. TS4A08]